VAVKKSSRLWDYLGAISYTKDVSVLDDPDFEKVYVPYIINRALSQHEDSVLAAQLMNEHPQLPAPAQFLFLLNTLRARRRFGDWQKHTDSDDLCAVAEYYGLSRRAARDLVSLHTSEQLATVYRRLDKGGTTKNTKVAVNDT
jgi:hypothetical protein